MKKNLMLCALLLVVLLSGCAAEPLQSQTAGSTPEDSTPQEDDFSSLSRYPQNQAHP